MADPIDMTEFRLRRKAMEERNAMLIKRVVGVPALPCTPELEADPRNPNIKVQ